jgi:hypothetical protein
MKIICIYSIEYFRKECKHLTAKDKYDPMRKECNYIFFSHLRPTERKGCIY